MRRQDAGCTRGHWAGFRDRVRVKSGWIELAAGLTQLAVLTTGNVVLPMADRVPDRIEGRRNSRVAIPCRKFARCLCSTRGCVDDPFGLGLNGRSVLINSPPPMGMAEVVLESVLYA